MAAELRVVGSPVVGGSFPVPDRRHARTLPWVRPVEVDVATHRAQPLRAVVVRRRGDEPRDRALVPFVVRVLHVDQERAALPCGSPGRGGRRGRAAQPARSRRRSPRCRGPGADGGTGRGHRAVLAPRCSPERRRPMPGARRPPSRRCGGTSRGVSGRRPARRRSAAADDRTVVVGPADLDVGSTSREPLKSGRMLAWSARSATRAARFADRTETNVAIASASVPPAVASAEIVAQSSTPEA